MPIGGATFAGGRAARSGFSWWDRLLLLAGLRHGADYLRIFAPIVAARCWPGPLGALSGFVTLLLLTVGAYFLLWLRADKRQRRMISQLPAFLDNMVRLITIGNSMASAFQTAAASADAPLREVVETAAALSRSAKELDEALAHVSRQYGLKELYMVAAVVSIALRFGGRSDQVLERMAAFMRDVSQAAASCRPARPRSACRPGSWLCCRWASPVSSSWPTTICSWDCGRTRWASRCWRPPWPCRSADPIGCTAWPNPSDGARMQALESLNPTLVLAMALTLVAVAMLVLGVSMVRRLRGQGRSRQVVDQALATRSGRPKAAEPEEPGRLAAAARAADSFGNA